MDGNGVMEKAVLLLGSLLGIGAGIAFYCLVEELRLPALIFAVVDLFGIVPATIIVGLMSFVIGAGALVLIADRFFPERNGN